MFSCSATMFLSGLSTRAFMSKSFCSLLYCVYLIILLNIDQLCFSDLTGPNFAFQTSSLAFRHVDFLFHLLLIGEYQYLCHFYCYIYCTHFYDTFYRVYLFSLLHCFIYIFCASFSET